MATPRFYLSEQDLNTFEADRWQRDQNHKLADQWASDALSRLGSGFEPQPATPQEAQQPPLAQSAPQDVPAPTPPEPLPAQSPSMPADAPVLDLSKPAPVSPEAPLPQPNRVPPTSPVRSAAALPSGGLADVVRQAAQKYGVDPNTALRVAQSEGGLTEGALSGDSGSSFGPFQLHYGGVATGGNAVSGLGDEFTRITGLDARDPRNAAATIDFALQHAAKNGWGAFHGAGRVGIANFEGIGGQPVASPPGSASTDLSLSQFGDKTISADEAYAACGPAAASRLAALYGNNIPLSVALQAAKSVGWTTQGGMNGIQNEKRLMDALNLPAELDTSGNWSRIVSEAGAGKMVTISTPGHYFSASGARQRGDQTELYVGQSGLDLKGGKAWMTPAEIEQAMGKINGALFSDPSRMVAAGDWMQRATQDHGIQPESPDQTINDLVAAKQKIRPDETVSNPFGEAFRQAGNVAGQVGGALQATGARVQSPNTGNPIVDAAGTGLSALGTGVQSVLSPFGGASEQFPTGGPAAGPIIGGLRTAAGFEQMGREGATEAERQLKDLTRRQDAGEPGLDAEIDHWAQVYDQATHRGGGDQAVFEAAQRNPTIGGLETLGGIAQGVAAAPLAVESAPLVAKAAAAAIDPLTGLPAVAGRALEAAGPALRSGQRAEMDLGLVTGHGPTVGAGGAAAGPASQGATANNTLLNMYGRVKSEDPAALPGRIEEARRFLVRKWTDRGIDLSEFQKDAQKAAGRPLTADEMAYEMRRLNPSGAADARIQNELKPAIQSVGADADWLKVYLTHKDNLDVARAMGQKVEGAAVDAIPETNAAVRKAEATLRGRQQYLDRLTADVNTPAERIRAAQNAVNSAQRSVDTATAAHDVTRTASLGEATRAGAQAMADRSFSGGLSVADSEAGLADMAQQLGPERMAKIEQAAQQITDYGKALLQRKVDAGLIPQSTYDDLVTKYPNYSPTRILDYMKDPAGIPSGRKISVQSAGLKRNTVEGTTRQREDPLASFVRLAHETEALATQNEVAQAFLKLRDLNPDTALMIRKVADDVSSPRGYEKMKVFEDGVPQSYQMPSYIAKAIKEEPVAPIPLMTPLMNLFRMAATQRNPVFLVSNALNDSVAYTLRSSSRLGGPQNIPKIAAELVRAYGDAFQGIFKGEFRGDTARYLAGGGSQSGFFSHLPEDALKVSEALQRPHVFAIRGDHVVQDISRLVGQALTLKPVEAIGERIELAPRVAAMRLAEKSGATPQQAVLAGRTVTIDFSQGGTWAKVLNQVIPFFNVAVQAGTQLPRAFHENPRGFITTAAGTLAAPTVAIEAWNRSDPQRAKDYEDVPQYVKDAGLVFMLPTPPQTDEKGNRKPQYLFLPTREYSPFVTVTREAAGRAMGADPRGWGDLLVGTGRSVSPVSGNSGADVFSTGVPLGVSTAMQLATDRDWYRNSRIVSTQADEQASAFSKAASDALNKMGLETRPSAVEFAARDVGAGVGGMLLAGSDMAVGKPRKDERIQSTPGVGGLVGRFVQDRTGERLNRAIDQPVPVPVEQALKEAGVATPTLPATISIRSQLTGSNSPPIALRQQERAEYQRLMAERLSERIAPLLAQPGWASRPIASRNAVLEQQVKAAREYAEGRVFASMDPADRQKRMAEGRVAQ